MGTLLAYGPDVVGLPGGPLHGVFEVWKNISTGEFATQNIEIEGDYDVFLVEYGRPGILMQGIMPLDSEEAAKQAPLHQTVMQSNKITVYYRDMSLTKNGNINTIAFGNCSYSVYGNYGSAATNTGTNNAMLVPLRILGIVHND